MDYNNVKTVNVVFVSEGYVYKRGKALLEDIANSSDDIRVINDEGSVEIDNVNDMQFVDYPYAVIVDGDGKPVRTIRVNPTSYVNAGDDEEVDCICGEKHMTIPKKIINILS